MEINQAIETIMQTRDLCGNELEALLEWEEENGKLSEHQRSQVWKGVADEWKLCQLNALVHRALTDNERLQAFRDVESD